MCCQTETFIRRAGLDPPPRDRRPSRQPIYAAGQDPPYVRYGGAHPDRRGDGMDRRHFIGSAALAALLPFVGGGRAFAATRGRLLPVPLNPGDTVGLVSPSSATAGRLNLQLAREVMQALGFKVKTGAHYASRYGHLAGTDAERARRAVSHLAAVMRGQAG